MLSGGITVQVLAPHDRDGGFAGAGSNFSCPPQPILASLRRTRRESRQRSVFLEMEWVPGSNRVRRFADLEPRVVVAQSSGRVSGDWRCRVHPGNICVTIRQTISSSGLPFPLRLSRSLASGQHNTPAR